MILPLYILQNIPEHSRTFWDPQEPSKTFWIPIEPSEIL